MSRILAGVDYENTYCCGGVSPDDEKVAAVAKFRRDGGIFGIVTRRNVLEAKGIEVLYRGEYDFVLCSSGSACFLKDGGFLWRDSFDRMTVEGLYKLCDRRGGYGAYLDTVGCCGMLKNTDVSGEMGCGIMHYDGNFNIGRVGAAGLQLVMGVTEFTVFFPSEKLTRGVMDEIECEFGGRLVCHPFGIGGFDVVRSDRDRMSGLRRVAEYYGVSESDIRAVGLDEWNRTDLVSGIE